MSEFFVGFGEDEPEDDDCFSKANSDHFRTNTVAGNLSQQEINFELMDSINDYVLMGRNTPEELLRHVPYNSPNLKLLKLDIALNLAMKYIKNWQILESVKSLYLGMKSNGCSTLYDVSEAIKFYDKHRMGSNSLDMHMAYFVLTWIGNSLGSEILITYEQMLKVLRAIEPDKSELSLYTIIFTGLDKLKNID